MTALRSAAFLVWFLLVSLFLHLALLPLLFGSRRQPVQAARIWGRATLFGLKWIAGVAWELRGREHVPAGANFVAVKHFSMWETLVLTDLLPDPAFVLKRELTRIPFYGWYMSKSEMIPIDRDAGPRAIRSMRDAARRALADDRQIVIFPEGTRVQPGAPPDYKPGVAALYVQLGLACVPVAHNSGLFWTGFLKRPGTVVLEFLPPIPARLPRETFMRELETRMETATNRLLDEGRARSSVAHPGARGATAGRGAPSP